MMSSAPKTAYLAGGLTLIMALVGASRICFGADPSQPLRLPCGLPLTLSDIRAIGGSFVEAHASEVMAPLRKAD